MACTQLPRALRALTARVPFRRPLRRPSCFPCSASLRAGAAHGPSCCPPRLPTRFSLCGSGRCAAWALPFPLPGGFVPSLRSCSSPPFRCAVLVRRHLFPFPLRVMLLAGLRPGPGGPSLVLLVHRCCRLRRAVRCPARFSCWFTECYSLSGAAPLPLLLRRRCFAGVPSFHLVVVMLLLGAAPLCFSILCPAWFHDVFDGASPRAGGPSLDDCSCGDCACGGR